MQISDAPSKLVLPFANAGAKNTIPVTPSGTPGAASYTDGFPAETMEPVTSGGVPPSGQDFNGVLFEMSAVDVWNSAGAGFIWDSAFSTAIGGYPAGARVFMASGTGYWLNTVDNNTTDPDTGGAGWVPENGKAVASVYASTQQTIATPGAKVIFNTVEFDDNGLWDAANHRFKAIYAGKYRLSGVVVLNAPGGQSLATAIYKNGVEVKRGFQTAQVSDVDLSLPFDAIVNLAINDYLEVFVLNPQTNVLAGLASVSNQPYVFSQVEFLGS